MLRVLSLGAGIQSSTLLFMVLQGKLPRVDAVVFADTGWEPKQVYNYVEYLKNLCRDNGLSFFTVSQGNIKEDSLKTEHRFASMPFFVRTTEGKKGLLRRQCTSEYKVRPIQRLIRELMAGGSDGKVTELWLGISTDEAGRMRDSKVRYIQHRYPLIEHNMSRQDCVQFIEKNAYLMPVKSACIGCPFHSDRYWHSMQKNSPEEFAEAVYFDNHIRQLPRIKGDVFLHRSLAPLSELDFSTHRASEQLDMFQNECEGLCGV